MQELPVGIVHRNQAPGYSRTAGSNAVYLPLRTQKTVFLPGRPGYFENALRTDRGLPVDTVGTGFFDFGFLQIVTYLGVKSCLNYMKIYTRTYTMIYTTNLPVKSISS